jgi:hypothetical protein
MRASMRAAAYNYINNGVTAGNIPYIGTVFPSRPLIVTEDDYETQLANGLISYVTSPDGSAGVVIVNMPETNRKRRTLTGYGGSVDDTAIHPMELEVFMGNAAGDVLALQADHDSTVDAIVIAIRADPTLGTAGNPEAIFGAGVFDQPVTVHAGPAFQLPDGPTVFIPAVVRFEAWEWISGQGV